VALDAMRATPSNRCGEPRTRLRRSPDDVRSCWVQPGGVSHAGKRKVTIVGGGVAALEALLALRSLAGGLTDLEVVSATPDFVSEPFGLGTAHRFDLSHIAREHGATLHVAGVDMVEPEEHRLVTWDGRRFEYDLLLVAVGAHSTTAIPGSVSIQGPAYTSRFRTVLRKLDKHGMTRVAFAVPAGASWPLPLYELALLTATHVAERGLRKIRLQLVTHESEPLELFGPKASAAVRELLEERNVEVVTNRVPLQARRGELVTAPGPAIETDAVVSLPGLSGPALRGLPSDNDGFVPVDLHGRVQGLDDVYAAGDATTCPIKQGGVAAQQADAAAQAIAARVGALVDPRPFRPVLRGLLLTGGVPRYLRSEVAGGRGEDWQVSEEALWWPPSKVAGQYLAPYLAGHVGDIDAPSSGLDVEVPLDGDGTRRRALVVPGVDDRAPAVPTDRR
jgi:sulfide:quinone oxidoreductase